MLIQMQYSMKFVYLLLVYKATDSLRHVLYLVSNFFNHRKAFFPSHYTCLIVVLHSRVGLIMLRHLDSLQLRLETAAIILQIHVNPLPLDNIWENYSYS